MFKVRRQPHGVAIVWPDEAVDENLPGQLNLTFDDVEELVSKLEVVLQRRNSGTKA